MINLLCDFRNETPFLMIILFSGSRNAGFCYIPTLKMKLVSVTSKKKRPGKLRKKNNSNPGRSLGAQPPNGNGFERRCETR